MISFRIPIFTSPFRLPFLLRPRAWLVAAATAAGLASYAATTAPIRPDDEFYVRIWGTDDGLSYNLISRVLQDSQGFLWLATSGGLSRYDGHQFKDIKLPKEFRPGGYNIRGLVEEDAHTLIILPTSNQVVRLRDGRFSLHPASSALGGKEPVELFLDSGGALWLGVADQTLLRWENGRAQWFGPADGIGPGTGRFTFAAGADGETWVANGSFLGHYRDGRLLRFDAGSGPDRMIATGSKGRIWVCTPAELQELDGGTLRVLSREVPWQGGNFPALQHCFEDPTGALWLAVGRFGLYRWERNTFQHIPAPTPARFVAKDREGNLWVATSGNGLAQLHQKTYRLFDARSGLIENASTGVHVDAGGEIWLANNSGGIARLRDNQAEPLHLVYSGRPLWANTVCTDQTGNLWCGGPQGLFLVPKPAPGGAARKLPSPTQNLRLLFCSDRGDMWFASAPPAHVGYYRGGTAHLLSPAEGYTGQTIRAIAEDAAGSIWLGAQNGDLLRFADGRLTRFSSADGLPAQPIQDLLADQSGSLWIATAGGLVLRQENRFHLFTQADGLADELIGRILADDRGLLWVISRSGIYFVDSHELLALARGAASHVVSYRYARNQGLINVSPLVNYQPAAAKTPDGRLWFATASGVVTLDPSRLDLGSPPPPILIDEVWVDDRLVADRSHIQFPAGSHRIEFRFSAPSFAFERVQLNHQLQGADPNWIETSDSHAASYSGLAPGTYRLQARARNGMGAWSPAPASLSFTVLPPWWQNPWVRVGLAAAAAIGLAWAVQSQSQRQLKRRLLRLERAHDLEQERSRIARDLHDELGGSLTEIGLLADRLRYLPGPELSSALSKLIAHTRQLHVELASIIWTISPKNNSLDRLADFLQKYAGRFFRYSEISYLRDNTDAIPARPLGPDTQHHLLAFVKEALNNVLSHSHATRATIKTHFQDDCFHLIIEDDGVGFALDEVGENQGNGLTNMRARIAEIGGTLRIESGPKSGTRLIVTYPCGPAASAGAPPFPPARN